MRYEKSKEVEKAQKLASKGKVGAALQQYRDIAKHDPADAHVWLKIAELSKRSDDPASAADALRRAGLEFHRRGFATRALAALEQASRIEPHDGELQMELGQICLELRREADARRFYTAAADAFVDESKPARALEALAQVVELAPNDLHQRYRLARMLEEQGRQGDALQHYLSLAGVLLARGEARRALQVLRPAYESQPENTTVLEAMARAFAAAGLPDREQAVLRQRERVMNNARDVAAEQPRIARGTERNPPTDTEDAQLRKLFNEAVVYMRYGLQERAVELLEAVLQQQPDHADARKALDELQRS